MATFFNYGTVTYQRQAQIMKELADPQPEIISQDVNQLAKTLAQEMRNTGMRVG